ncbi:DUF2797 domain-containing protein [Thermoflavimicrobium daqui]|jgi:hypothetical protein|uniref:DUF2797 domain-containing protein n=1 Tax=Thermoflavimicrobium daqui TaxID=2137476 RepID=A0A364K1D4_9BACL|nr:DUF2797 domain-containing protein [Thermoflavimicrobium daqui]RAL21848.1 DUF2797 domain-containing protein [Thermoflavimicrobium daqui]
MEQIGYLEPLQHEPSTPVTYYLPVGNERVLLNEALGETIQLTFLGEKACRHCGRKIKKTYNNGYCYPCYTNLAENDLCIVKPELCHFHKGTCRDTAFGEKFCMQAHYVYLALSSEVKVGITRKPNALKRWIDQGAVAALPIMEVPSRKIAGELEVHLAQYIKDKTNWRKMLKNDIRDENLIEVRAQIVEKIPEEYHPYLLPINEPYTFNYPHLSVPDKITSLNLDKQAVITAKLMGIKAQYLIFDQGVLNIRKHTGYKVSWHI